MLKAGNIQDKEFALFSGYMRSADFARAGVHLSRWNSLQKEKNSRTYISSRWLMELLSGKIKESFAVLDSYKPAGDDEKAGIKLRRAYTYFYSGDMKNAEKELSGISPSDAIQAELNIFNAMIGVIRDGYFSSADLITGMKKPYNGIIPIERYLIPAAEFLYLSRDERACKTRRAYS
ncbi:MAG: hypothetical protein M0C28_20565 [Candidatus Moduliflexus flocculans]|nr:hypothetical protein [Candidatus Moduliflexus flocculans]